MKTDEIQRKPYVVTVSDYCHIAFEHAAALVRVGYTFSKDALPEIFPANGTCNLTLVLGNPDGPAIKAAEAHIALATEFEEAKYQRDVQAAAKMLVEQAAREEKQKQLAALRAEQEKAIAKLQAELVK